MTDIVSKAERYLKYNPKFFTGKYNISYRLADIRVRIELVNGKPYRLSINYHPLNNKHYYFLFYNIDRGEIKVSRKTKPCSKEQLDRFIKYVEKHSKLSILLG